MAGGALQEPLTVGAIGVVGAWKPRTADGSTLTDVGTSTSCCGWGGGGGGNINTL